LACTPTLTLMVVPRWGTAHFMPYLKHPLVTILDAPSASALPLALPPHIAPPLDWPAPRPTHSHLVLIIANLTGVALLYHPDLWQAAYSAAMPSRVGQRLRLARPVVSLAPFPRWSGVPPRRFCPPAPRSCLPDFSSPQAPLPFRGRFPLAWAGAPALYTDGSCRKHPDGTQTLGAGFYDPVADSEYTVCPRGHSDTNTITRAELSAVLAALRHAVTMPPSPLVLFTDSLASILLVRASLRRPDTLWEHKHAPMLVAIRALLLSRASLALHTTLQKVRAHSGLHGNDRADHAATAAALDPLSCTSTVPDGLNGYLASLPAWPCALPPPSDPQAQPRLLADLGRAVTSHILRTNPGVAAGVHLAKHYSSVQEAASSASEPCVGDWVWRTSSCPWRALRLVLLVRFGVLWTARRALLLNLPYVLPGGAVTTGACPLCGAPDSAGHILGSCPALADYVISRHNKAVAFIQEAVGLGSLSGCFTVMDACARADLPAGVADTRLPAWLLPDVPAEVLSRLRPDMLLVQGMPATAPASAGFYTPGAQARFRASCTISILEVGYASDSGFQDTLALKQTQHLDLCARLVAAGWTLSLTPSGCPFRVILLGTTGHVFAPALATLLHFGVSHQHAVALLRRLCTHATLFVLSIVCRRRRLERSLPLLAFPYRPP
jgi:ribonuclease HI